MANKQFYIALQKGNKTIKIFLDILIALFFTRQLFVCYCFIQLLFTKFCFW